MYEMFPLPEGFSFNEEHFEKLIRERENITAICRHHNQKKRVASKKKEKTMQEIIMSLEGEELDQYLRDQGFTLKK